MSKLQIHTGDDIKVEGGRSVKVMGSVVKVGAEKLDRVLGVTLDRSPAHRGRPQRPIRPEGERIVKGITTIASLPGSGAGCVSALPAEVGKEVAPCRRPTMSERGPELLKPLVVNINFAVGDEATVSLVREAVAAARRRAHSHAQRYDGDERN